MFSIVKTLQLLDLVIQHLRTHIKSEIDLK